MPQRCTLPRRSGERPRTTPTNPHTQLDQQPVDLAPVTELARRAFALPDVAERPSLISVPGARGMFLRDGVPVGPADAFLVDREFAHFHPGRDRSLHTMLPLPLGEEVIATGWGELHPVARMGYIPRTAVMLYAPRDEGELEVLSWLVTASYTFAGGRGAPAGSV